MAWQFPQVSKWTAVALGGSFAFSYVASLYIFKAGRLVFTARAVEVGLGAERARLENERWRSDPSVIRARLASVSLSTLTSCGAVFMILRVPNHPVFHIFSKTLELLGLQFPSHVPLGAWFLAPLLYLGPLYSQMLKHELPFQRHWSYAANIRPIFGDWIGIRNFVVAPITEEIVFRSCVIGVMRLANCSWSSMIFLSPLWFGAAHLHHGWDLYNRFGNSRAAFKRAVFTVSFQQVYTSLFGWFEAFLFLRTGSVWPCIAAHTFCNLHGLVLPGQLAREHPNRKHSIWFTYLLGMVSFGFALGPWTDSSMDMASRLSEYTRTLKGL